MERSSACGFFKGDERVYIAKPPLIDHPVTGIVNQELDDDDCGYYEVRLDQPVYWNDDSIVYVQGGKMVLNYDRPSILELKNENS